MIEDRRHKHKLFMYSTNFVSMKIPFDDIEVVVQLIFANLFSLFIACLEV